MLVLIFEDDEKVDLQKLKIFLDKNLVLKGMILSYHMTYIIWSDVSRFGNRIELVKDFPSDGSKTKNDQKNEINFFLCNDINGISNENMFQYKYM